MSTIRNASILAVAVSMAVSGQVNAQRSTTSEIEEVVVTAQKREENMQDVAISMSAMDANTIEKTFSRTIDAPQEYPAVVQLRAGTGWTRPRCVDWF